MQKTLIRALAILCLISIPALPAFAIDEGRLKTFLEGNDYWNVRLAPDGKHLSLLTKREDRNTLVIMNIETMEPTAAVKYEEAMDIEIFNAEWVNSDLVRYSITRKFAQYESAFVHPDLFLVSVDGKRNERIWSRFGNVLNQRTKETVRGFPSYLAKYPDSDDELLIYVRSFARRDGAGRGGIYRLNLDSSLVKHYAKVPAYTSEVLSDEAGTIFVALVLNRESERHVLITHNKVDWEPLNHDLGHLSTEFTPFKIAGDFLYGRAQSGEAIDAETHIIRYNMTTDEWEDVFEIGFASISDVAIGDDGQLDRVQWIDAKPKIAVLDKTDKVSQVVSAFARNYEGFNVNVISVTDDESKMLLHVGSAAHAGEYFLFDFDTKKANFLIAMQAAIDGNELSELEDATFVSSDGVTIPGWFQTPKGGEKPPLVVYIHGGPHGPYNAFGFNTRWHLLNEMGYAVYAPNFRGSGGYGPNFEYAGYGQWGTRMIDDMYEGVQALIEAGKIDPDRVCVFGGSYGGYASTQSLVRHNDFYKCGVIIAGVFDLRLMMKYTDIADSYMGDNYMAKAIGDNEDALTEMSPRQNIDKIKAPMLILHGKEDERTPFKDAVDFVDALKEQNKNFQYRWYDKEGHGNAKLENRIDEWQLIEEFFSENL